MERVLAQNLAAAGLFIWALKRGGAPERYLSGCLVIALWLNLFIRHVLQVTTSFGEADWPSILLELAVLSFAVWTALKCNRIWPLWFSALQIIATISYLLREVSQQMHPMSYSIFMRVPTYGQLVVLFCAMIACERRSRLGIAVPDWTR